MNLIADQILSIDAAGKPVIGDLVLGKLWGEVLQVTGLERFVADQQLASLTHQVTVPYRRDLSPKMRLTFEGRTLNIEAVLGNSSHSELRLLCREKAAT
ncbi:MAG TPA: phage head closure protein [Pirellulales bacterium]|jgi:SPP1 family predicted phage head-tail adaptor